MDYNHPGLHLSVWLIWAGLAITWIIRSTFLYLRYPVIAGALQQNRVRNKNTKNRR